MIKNMETMVIVTLSAFLFLLLVVFGITIIDLRKDITDLEEKIGFFETRLKMEEGLYYEP